ncbi:SgcJ/EcaC family oxidoreductase [Microvirga sp. TS319]|uniref:YybH family protein n=1 Tax=Microvirga sp. TS319 TaxID=3241165 RepID=UPI00351AA6AD
MTDDEKAIRELVAAWMAASLEGNVAKVLSLMTEDVIFMVPGRDPFGREAFAAASRSMEGMRLEGTSDILELQVMGDWAFMRCHIDMTITPPNAREPVRRSGHTLTLLRKGADGRWRLARDANLLAARG